MHYLINTDTSKCTFVLQFTDLTAHLFRATYNLPNPICLNNEVCPANFNDKRNITLLIVSMNIISIFYELHHTVSV